MNKVNSIAALLFCGMIAAAVWKRLMAHEPVSGPVKPAGSRVNYKAVMLILGAALLVAVRLLKFPDIPGGINQDGTMGAVDAKALADYGTDRFGTFMPAHFKAWGYSQMSVLLSYLTVPFIKIFGLSRLTMRLPILLASIAGAAGIYGVVRKVSGEWTAVVTVWFAAVNPWHFMQSRWALDCNLFPHMFVIGVYFLLGGLKKRKRLYISMIFFALCMYCYGVSFYMVPFFLLMVCILLLVQRRVDWRDVIVCLLVYFGIAWPIYGTMLINFMKWETVELPFVTMPYFADSVRAGDILFFSGDIGRQFINNARSLLNVVFLQKEDLLWNSIKNFGTMYRCSMPFVFLGGIKIFSGAFREKDGDVRTGCQILAAFWVFAVLTGLMINNINVNRINIVFYIHIIFAAVGISFVVREWKITFFAILAVYGMQSMLFFHTYFTSWAQEIRAPFYADFVDAMEYTREFDCDYYCISLGEEYVGAQNLMEILTLYLFDVDAGYYQGATDQWRGKEIAYQDRFRYSAWPAAEEMPSGRTAYVFESRAAVFFPEDEFQVTIFGDYGAAIPLPLISD